MDGVLARATSQWHAAQLRQVRDDVKRETPSKPKNSGSERRRRLPEPPPGWNTDDASRSSMLAAKMLNRGGQ